MKKILINIALILGFVWVMYGVVNASTMQFFPSSWNFAMYCIYSGEVRVVNNTSRISSFDSKIFSENIVLTWFWETLSGGTYYYLPTTWFSLYSVSYPWKSYLANTPYTYVNWYAHDLDNRLPVWNLSLFSYLFVSSGMYANWSMDFYYVPWENYDDSNLQSGALNAMKDSLTLIEETVYNFMPMPCIIDEDKPLFTGYLSGWVYNSSDSWLNFTIYDYIWDHIVWYNKTEHYRFTSFPTDSWNLLNYVPVSVGSGIDNQEGVNSWTISVYLSGISVFSSWALLAPTTFSITWLDCNQTYSWEWYFLTRNRNKRWYTCLVPFDSIYFDVSQTILVVITWSDNANYLWNTNTGSISFLVNVVKSWTIFDIKAYPGSRPWWNFINIWELKFYNTSKSLVTWFVVDTNSTGTNTLNLKVPAGMYYVVYKWQSHLASYLSWVSVMDWSVINLDFTTWANLYDTQNKSISVDDWSQYQIAGDLKNILWVYDFTVNGNDISILTMSWFIPSGVDVLDPKNLNADWAINVSDISVIGTNFELKDSYFPGNLFVW